MNRNFGQGPVGSPTLHATILFTISVFVAILTMSYLFKVEIVAKGIGKVVPLGRVGVIARFVRRVTLGVNKVGTFCV